MRNRHFLAFVCLALACGAGGSAAAATVSGIEFTERFEWRGLTLRLNGAGVLRYRVFIKGYAAALYLGEEVAPDRALEDVPRRLEIEYLWAIPAEAFVRVTQDSIARNVDEETLAGMRGAIEQLNRLYEDVEPGDRYALTYVPGVGTELALNGEPRGVVEGAAFSSALFSIWLGEKPVNEPLRERLLSRG